MKKCFIPALLAAALILSACGGAGEAAYTPNESPKQSAEVPAEGGAMPDADALFSSRDYETDYDANTAVCITLLGESAECASSAVEISGGEIIINDEGTYILSGTLTDGSVTVNADKTDKIRLVLDNVSINCRGSAAVCVLQADKLFITTAEGSLNSLTNEEGFDSESNVDAVIFSKEDLTLNGLGLLKIGSPTGHGIVSKDSLTLTGGSYEINAAGHGLCGKDDVSIAGGDFAITAGRASVRGDNDDDPSLGSVYILGGSFAINSGENGISSSASVYIAGGSFDICSGGGSAEVTWQQSDFMQMPGGFGGGHGRPDGGVPGERPDGGHMGAFPEGNMPEAGTAAEDESSAKGIKAETELIITGGSFNVDALDDALHSDGSIYIHGGSLQIASGDDAVHAEERLEILDGSIKVSKSYEGLEALHILISGGELELCSQDDGLNAAGGVDQSGFGGRDGRFDPAAGGASDGSIVISGGTLNITAYGDGIDANGSIELIGGYITVCGPNMGDTATLDYDTSAVISGASFIGTGASGMAQTFSEAGQGIIAVRVGNQPAGAEISISGPEGDVLLSYTAPMDFSVIIISTPELIKGESYTVTVGDVSGEITA